MLEYFIKTYTNQDDIVLDSCMGVGSTGIACKNLDRSFIGIEKDEQYFNIAKKRIEPHSVKPECFYELVNRCSFDNKLELFARKEREGYDCFGN